MTDYRLGSSDTAEGNRVEANVKEDQELADSTDGDHRLALELRRDEAEPLLSIPIGETRVK